MQDAVREVKLSQIRTTTVNVRRHDRDKGVEDLANSIKAVGLLQPVILRGEYGKPPYDLIVGQRRVLAHRHLERDKISALFEAPDMTDQEARIRSIAENALRVELNHADAAEAISELYNDFDRDIGRVQAATGMSLQMIRKYLYIRDRATPEMLDMLRSKKVRPQDVKRCLDAASEDLAKAQDLLELMATTKLTKYEKDRIVSYGQTEPALSAVRLIEKVQAPHVEEHVLLRLDAETKKGLEKAMKAMSLDAEALAQKALQEWLMNNGFM